MMFLYPAVLFKTNDVDAFLPEPPSGQQFAHVTVGLRSSVPEELPDLSGLFDDVEVEFSHEEFILVAACLGKDLAPFSASLLFFLYELSQQYCFVPLQEHN